MSKEEFLKIQTCVLKVNIHCDGCKQKVKKILQKIDGVFTTKIDAEQGKVTVSGNVDPNLLIKKLAKSGKHAEVWGASKANNNQGHLANQFKNMQIDNGKGGNTNNKGPKGNANNNNQPKGGPLNQQQLQHLQQLQQLQQMKAFQDMKLPQLKDMKMPSQQNQKAVKFAAPEDEDLTDEFDDLDDDEFDDDEFDYDMDEPHHSLNKMKPTTMGNGLHGLNNMMNGLHPQLMNGQKPAAANGGGNAKNGGEASGGNGAIPVQIHMGGGEGKNGNGGKKGGGAGGVGGGNNHGGHGGSQNQGGKNGGGKGQDGKNGNNGGGGNGIKNGSNGGACGGVPGNNMQMNGGKKGNNGGGASAVSDGFGSMRGPQGYMGQMGNMNMAMAQMGNMPMGQLGGLPAVQGLPAGAAMSGGGGGGGVGANGYFQGAGPDVMPGNPYHQQHMAAMMNQQRPMGNERFQPLMYARPPPAVNYMPQNPYPYPYPYPYPPHPHGSDPYTNFFSDENTSSCNVM